MSTCFTAISLHAVAGIQDTQMAKEFGRVKAILERYGLPTQEIHAVFPSPKLVPRTVNEFIEDLRGRWRGPGGNGGVRFGDDDSGMRPRHCIRKSGTQE